MDLKFKKKSTYDTTPGTITFNTSTKRIGVANTGGDVTEYGGGSTYIDELKLRNSDTNGSATSLNAGDLLFASDQNVNRFAFLPSSYISVQYSRNAGETWEDYPDLTSTDIYNFFSKKDFVQIYLGGSATNQTSDSQLKITITIPTTNYRFYASIRKFYIWASTNGTTNFTVDLTVYDKTNNKTHIIAKNHKLSGWSGYNTINCNTTIGGSEPTWGHGGTMEFIFKQTTATTGNHVGRSACIYSIFAYSDNIWAYPSNLARTGHMYDWYGLETVFPSSVYAYNKYDVDNKLMTASDVDSKIEDSWTWGEYD